LKKGGKVWDVCETMNIFHIMKQFKEEQEKSRKCIDDLEKKYFQLSQKLTEEKQDSEKKYCNLVQEIKQLKEDCFNHQQEIRQLKEDRCKYEEGMYEEIKKPSIPIKSQTESLTAKNAKVSY